MSGRRERAWEKHEEIQTRNSRTARAAEMSFSVQCTEFAREVRAVLPPKADFNTLRLCAP